MESEAFLVLCEGQAGVFSAHNMGEKLEVSFCLVKAREWKREFLELGKFLCLQFCVFCRKMTGCRLGCFFSSVFEQPHLCCCWVLHPRKPRARLCSWNKLIGLDRQRSDAEEVGMCCYHHCTAGLQLYECVSPTVGNFFPARAECREGSQGRQISCVVPMACLSPITVKEIQGN